MSSSAMPWVSRLRELIRLEHGRGWTITEQSGRVKLCYRGPDGRRHLWTLPISWNASAPTAVLAAVAAIRERMAGGVSFDAAVAGSAATPGALDWSAITAAFLASKGDLRATTLRDHRLRMRRVLAVVEAAADGPDAVRRYAARWLQGMPSGGSGRRRDTQTIAALLRFAVER